MTTTQPAADLINVLVADGRALSRAALVASLEAEGSYRVTDTACDAGEVADLVEKSDATIVIIDADLPGGGIEACAAVKARDLPARVLLLSDDSDQAQLLTAVEAGADGYLSREATLDQMMAAIEHLNAGEAWIPSGMLSVLLKDMIRRRRQEVEILDRFSSLSKREREVLALLVEGLDQRTIAQRLVLSPHTVRTHIQRLMERLGVHSRLEAVSFVLEHDLLDRLTPPGTTGDSSGGSRDDQR